MNNKVNLYCRSLSVHGKSFQVLEFKSMYRKNEIDAKDKIYEILTQNDIVFYCVGDKKIFTTDSGFFLIQMELLNEINIV